METEITLCTAVLCSGFDEWTCSHPLVTHPVSPSEATQSSWAGQEVNHRNSRENHISFQNKRPRSKNRNRLRVGVVQSSNLQKGCVVIEHIPAVKAQTAGTPATGSVHSLSKQKQFPVDLLSAKEKVPPVTNPSLSPDYTSLLLLLVGQHY